MGDTKSIAAMARGSAAAIEEHSERLDSLRAKISRDYREALASEIGKYRKELLQNGISELELAMLLGEYSRHLLRE